MYEELIKRLRRCEQFRCRECEYENVLGCRAKLNSEAADAIDKQNVIISGLNETIKIYANETPQWIPVTERLPEIGEKVLVFAYSKATLTARMCEQTENGYPVFECNGIFLEMAKPGRITHWMPPPEPPKEETC